MNQRTISSFFRIRSPNADRSEVACPSEAAATTAQASPTSSLDCSEASEWHLSPPDFVSVGDFAAAGAATEKQQKLPLQPHHSHKHKSSGEHKDGSKSSTLKRKTPGTNASVASNENENENISPSSSTAEVNVIGAFSLTRNESVVNLSSKRVFPGLSTTPDSHAASPTTLKRHKAANTKMKDPRAALICSFADLKNLNEINERWLPKFSNREKKYQRLLETPAGARFVNPTIRAILLDWMMQVSHEFVLVRSTLHSAVNFVDRFLIAQPKTARDRYQLVAATALLVSSKVHELHPPSSFDFLKATEDSYTQQELFDCERLLVQCLAWNLNPPTLCDALEGLCKLMAKQQLQQQNHDAKQVEELVSQQTFCDCAELLDVALMHVGSLQFPPTMLAVAALSLLRPEFLELVSDVSRYTTEHLNKCVEFLRPMMSFLSGSDNLEDVAPYFDVEIRPERQYTRQMHDPNKIDFMKELLEQQRRDCTLEDDDWSELQEEEEGGCGGEEYDDDDVDLVVAIPVEK